jgi:hypothetical protein
VLKRVTAVLAVLSVLAGCSSPAPSAPPPGPASTPATSRSRPAIFEPSTHPNPTTFDAYELDDSYTGDRYLFGYGALPPGPPTGTKIVTLAFGPAEDYSTGDIGHTVHIENDPTDPEEERRTILVSLYNMHLLPDLTGDDGISALPVEKLPPVPPAMKSVPVKADGTSVAFSVWQDAKGNWVAQAHVDRTAVTIDGPRSVPLESLSLRKVKDLANYQAHPAR